MSKRSWIKIHCDKWLNGSINKTGIEERGVWISLLCIAGNSDFGDIGFLSITQNQGMIDHQIANIMNVSVKTWRKYKERFTLAERITLHPNNVIEINNWTQFQSEYTRQKSYRPVVTEVTGRVTPEKEREKENKKENKESKPKKNNSKFIKPTILEIKEYCTSRNNEVDPQRFFDSYEAKGWKIGKTPMKDWKAAVRTWEQPKQSKKGDPEWLNQDKY